MIIFGYSFRVSIEKFTGSKIRSDLYIFFLFFSPSLPYCIHARNLSSPLKHQVKHPRDASLPSSSSSSSPIHRINRTRCTLSLLDSVFRFSRAGISERDLSLPLLQPFPPLSSSSPPANVIARPPRIEKERRCAKVDEKTRCIPSIYRFESENRFGEIASNRRDRDARERERGDCATRDSNIIVYFCTPARQRRKAFATIRKASSRRWKRRKERKRERKKNGPLAMPIFIPSSIVERERTIPPSPSSNSRRGFELARPRRSGG